VLAFGEPILLSSETIPRLSWCGYALCLICGCGQKIELSVIPEAKPRWDLRADLQGRPKPAPFGLPSAGDAAPLFGFERAVEWCDSARSVIELLVQVDLKPTCTFSRTTAPLLEHTLYAQIHAASANQYSIKHSIREIF